MAACPSFLPEPGPRVRDAPSRWRDAGWGCDQGDEALLWGPLGAWGDFSPGASVRPCWEASYLCSQLTWAPIAGGVPGHPEGRGVERGLRGSLQPTGFAAVGRSRTDGPSSLRAVCRKDPRPRSACLPLRSEACLLPRPRRGGCGLGGTSLALGLLGTEAVAGLFRVVGGQLSLGRWSQKSPRLPASRPPVLYNPSRGRSSERSAQRPAACTFR